MNKFASISALVFGIILVLGGIGHFAKPDLYNAFMPDFLPKMAINIVVGAVELVVGVGCFIPKYRTEALRFTGLLMGAFVAVHTLDVFREQPAIGSKTVASIRLVVQWFIVYWSWWAWRKHRDANSKPN